HAGQHGRNHVHAHVQLGIVFGLSGDDQRCTGFVDQDGVNFVDNRVGQTARAAILGAVFHIVAQVVKTKFVVGTVGNVSLIGSNLLGIVLLGNYDAHAQTQEVVQTPHPVRIASSQVIVDGHHVHAFAGQCIQVHGQGRSQGFTLTRTHFGNLAVVQGNGTEHLHVKVAHAKYTDTSHAYYCKSLGQ